MKSATLLLVALVLAACAQEREARLYPSNDEAAPTGVLRATYVDSGLGRGPINFTLPTGEKLAGEYTTLDNSTYGFGSILSLVGMGVGTSVGAASGSSVQTSGTQRGSASAIGDRGTRIECEYLVNVMAGTGTGACRTSKGAIYRLHFG